MASGLPPENPRHLRIGGKLVLVFQISRAEEADEWLRQAEEVWPGLKIIGLSFYWARRSLADGSLRRRVSSIHVSYLTDVLVYHLLPAANGAISPRLVDFLCDSRNFFFGEGIQRSLRALGFRGSRRHRFTMELTEVAWAFGLPIGAMLASRLPFHVAMAVLLLSDMDSDRLIQADLLDHLHCSFPMRDIHLRLAAQTSFVARKLGICACALNFS